MTSSFRFPANWQEISAVSEIWWKNLSYKNISSASLADCFLHITRLCLNDYRAFGGKERAFEVARSFYKVFGNNHRFSRNFNETFNYFEVFNVIFDIYIQKLKDENERQINFQKPTERAIGGVGNSELSFLVGHLNNRQLHFTQKYITYALLADRFFQSLNFPASAGEDMEHLFSLMSFFYGSKLVRSEDITRALITANYKEKSFFQANNHNKTTQALSYNLNTNFLTWLIYKTDVTFRKESTGPSLVSSFLYSSKSDAQDLAFIEGERKKLNAQRDVITAMIDYVALCYTKEEVRKCEREIGSGSYLGEYFLRSLYDKAVYKKSVLNEKDNISTSLESGVSVDKSKFKI